MIPYLTPEQLELRREVRKLLRARAPVARTREAMLGDRGYDDDVWSALAQEMGLVGLAVEPAGGGMGPAYVEIALVAEELGYLCVGVPFVGTTLAACALQSGASFAAAQELLPLLAAGERRAAVCLPAMGGWGAEPAASLEPVASLEPGATGDDGGWLLTGNWPSVLDADTADFLVVAATAGADVALFVVDSRGPQVAVQQVPMLDETRRFADVRLTKAPARRISPLGAHAVVQRVFDIGAILAAADSLGGARACLEMSVQYAKDREQFGRPIGSFQAIKFRCADMLVRVEAAASAVFYASRLLGSPDEQELPVVAPLAKAYCTEAYFAVAAETIQVHGGIGFTWEHDAHLYFKRATCSRLLWGDPESHRDRMLESAGVA